VAGGKGTINGLLQPGEIGTIVISTRYNAKMKANGCKCTYANGAVKVAKVKTLESTPCSRASEIDAFLWNRLSSALKAETCASAAERP
jgi:hypothetical protein